MKFGAVFANSVIINGQQQTIFARTSAANPVVRPERTQEAEYGADATFAGNIHFGLTRYSRRTTDQLNVLQVPSGFLPQWGNVGDVEGRGFEATLGTTLLDLQQLRFDINASYSHSTNKLLSLGSASGYENLYSSLVVGYPIGAVFGQTVASVYDTVGGGPDGIVQYNEIALTTKHYLGTFFAPNVYTLAPSLSLFGARLRISGVFDRQTGGVQYDPFLFSCGDQGLCTAQYYKSTSLIAQARMLSVADGSPIVSSDFTRWREFAITSDLAPMLGGKLRLAHASVSVQVRNIALWTSYKGPDPESVPGLGASGGNPGWGASGIPQGRSWTLRFDVTP
jgi:hypothetical protein